jgi:hypothetical protein
MKLVTAIVVDSTHLELNEPIHQEPGKRVVISISEEEMIDGVWQQAGMKNFLQAYDEQDSLYDEL